MRNLIITTSFLIVSASVLNAQDYHFTQFDALAPTYQPAQTGMFTDYYYRGATQYRNQWRPLASKPFSTFALSYDMPINERWGVGGYIVNYDGAKVFNAFNFIASGAYKITDPNQKQHLLTTGLQMGLIYKNTNNLDLLFDSQYSEGTFNPELASNEEFLRSSKLMPEFNLGCYYEWTDPANAYHPYAGFSIFHLTSPKEALLSNSDSRLPRRFLFNGGSKFDINREFQLDLKALYMRQGQARELVVGVLGDYLLREQNTKLKLGCYYRHKDAISILTGVNYRDLTFVMSFDITTSGLKEFNGSKGGVEFVLSYALSK